MSNAVKKMLPIVGRTLLDALIVLVAYMVAFQLRLLNWQPDDSHRMVIAGMALLYVAIGAIFGIYQRLWTNASFYEMFVIVKTVGVATIVIMIANFFWPGSEARLSTFAILLGSLFTFIGFFGTRYHWRMIQQVMIRVRARRGGVNRVLIIGAGEEGQLLARRFRESAGLDNYVLVGYLDDDPARIGKVVLGIKVLGRCDEVAYWTGRTHADTLIVAMHHVERSRLHDIIAACQETPARVQISPNLLNFAAPLPLRDITLDDLIGRTPAAINDAECRALLTGRRVLVTGAGGSIGSELVRQLAKFGPETIMICDNNETALYDLGHELRWLAPNQQLKIVLCDVSDQSRVERAFTLHRPEIVFHVAAYKHVPMLEEYASSAVTTNLWGTMNVSQAAARCGAERFIFVSTDKAVNPSSIMGTTKRLGELWVASMNNVPGNRTIFAAVRFGNVIGSRGSVVPLFWQQIERGGPVTVTHRDMTRFFMSIPEAASLIVQAAVYAAGQDIFMLDMGEEVRISDLAARMIRLRGLRVGEDIKIVYTGVRPGEKLHEELSLGSELREPTPHQRISRLSRELRWPTHESLRMLYGELLHINNQGDDVAMRKLVPLYLLAAEAGHSTITALDSAGLTESSRALIHDLNIGTVER